MNAFKKYFGLGLVCLSSISLILSIVAIINGLFSFKFEKEFFSWLLGWLLFVAILTFLFRIGFSFYRGNEKYKLLSLAEPLTWVFNNLRGYLKSQDYQIMNRNGFQPI